MPSRVSYPPDLEPQFCWNSQVPYGDRSLALSSVEPFNLSLCPSPIISYPGPPAYHYNSEPFIDSALDTPSLDGSSQDPPWDCPSSDQTALNTPTSAFSYNFNVQDTDSLKIMLSENPQDKLPYMRGFPKMQSPRTYPQHLLSRRPFSKRQRDSESLATEAWDMLSPEKITRVSIPHIPRSKVELSPEAEADMSMDYCDGNGAATPNGDDTDGEGGANSEPYAQLIYRALMSTPNHAMVLKEIYEWFEQNTDKAKIAPSSSAKGWQNSIRHNLSMNGAFNKVEQTPPTDDCKKGFIWVLADSALQEGVKSTTRYRKQNSNKKGLKTDHPAPQRQLSGAKGGKAAKKSAANANKVAASKLKRTMRSGKVPSSVLGDSRGASQLPTIEEFSGTGPQHELPYRPDNSPYYHHTPALSPLPSSSEPRAFAYGQIVGCAPDMEGPLFYEEPMDSPDGPMLSNQSFAEMGDHLLGYDFGNALPQ
ncbi:MAG: hypothetical protein Q9195_000804 [Heterodermia aff. obscurata]